jgi:hypothetical protein
VTITPGCREFAVRLHPSSCNGTKLVFVFNDVNIEWTDRQSEIAYLKTPGQLICMENVGQFGM